MIDYIIYSNSVATKPTFNIKDIPGTSGRLDAIFRSILAVTNSSFYKRIKPRIIIVLENREGVSKTIFIEELLRENRFKDEFTAARIFHEILRSEKIYSSNMKYKWLKVCGKTLIELVEYLQANSKIYYMHLDGKPVDTIMFNREMNYAFILGDRWGIPSDNEKRLLELGVERISLGPVEYLTSHCLTLIQDCLITNLKFE